MTKKSPESFRDLVTIRPAARRILPPALIARSLVRYWAGDRGIAYGMDREFMGCYLYNDAADEFWIEEYPATGRLHVRIPRLDKSGTTC